MNMQKPGKKRKPGNIKIKDRENRIKGWIRSSRNKGNKEKKYKHKARRIS
jgi:hypothetical protein